MGIAARGRCAGNLTKSATSVEAWNVVPARPIVRSLSVLALLGTLASPGSGQPPAAVRTHDYSRFSDGPRRVPRPRGASLKRAQALGLGSREMAKKLLHAPPEPRWVRAARGRVPAALHWPVDGGRFGRGFGYVRRRRPDLRHDGLDIVAPEQTVIRAVADGIVAYSDNSIRGFGNCLMIIHPNGWVSVYAHNYRNTVQPGWRVTRGERIGFVGHTGIARGPHLHFELRVDGHPVDPAPLFRQVPRKGDRFFDPHARPDASVAVEETRALEQEALASFPHELGTVGLARHVMAAPTDDSVLEALDLRYFRNLLWPAKGGELTRGFEPGGHRGLDIAAETGTAVRAAADGVVLYAGEGLDGVGAAVVMLHRNGWTTLYGGNRELHVKAGQRVLRGEWIAEIGPDPDGEAPHLHFELHEEGALRDPAPLLVQVPSGSE